MATGLLQKTGKAGGNMRSVLKKTSQPVSQKTLVRKETVGFLSLFSGFED
jgi:hypothetical protein